MQFKIEKVKSLPREPKPMLLQKVISGGQNGSSIAGLRAARKFGIKTGGYMPEDFMVQNTRRPKPGYFWMYGCIDNIPHVDGIPDWRSCQWHNVAHSDATLRLGTNFGTSEEIYCLKALRYYKRPHLDIWMEDDYILPPEEVAHWLVINEVQILNVSGNVHQDQEKTIESYLLEILNIIKWGELSND